MSSKLPKVADYLAIMNSKRFDTNLLKSCYAKMRHVY